MLNLAPYRKAIAGFVGAALSGGLIRLQTLLMDKGTLTREDWLSVAVAALLAGLTGSGIVLVAPRNVPKVMTPQPPIGAHGDPDQHAVGANGELPPL